MKNQEGREDGGGQGGGRERERERERQGAVEKYRRIEEIINNLAPI